MRGLHTIAVLGALAAMASAGPGPRRDEEDLDVSPEDPDPRREGYDPSTGRQIARDVVRVNGRGRGPNFPNATHSREIARRLRQRQRREEKGR